jgi:hypothetical protein
MITSVEEAMGVLNKWKNDPREIQVVFTGAGEDGVPPPEKAVACFWGFVKSVLPARVSVVSRMDPFFSISIELTGARFTYGDPREASTLQERDYLASKYVCSLAIVLPTGGRCVLAELRE